MKEILNPAKDYELQLKHEEEANAEQMFDELVKEQGINVAANQATVAKIKEAEGLSSDAAKAAKKGKFFKAIFQRKKLKAQRAAEADAQGNLDKLKQEGFAQLANMNALSDWRIPLQLFRKTAPIIELDDFYDPRRAEVLEKKYKLPQLQGNESTLNVQSGEIIGNPFVFYSTLKAGMQNKTYSGSLTISWQEQYKDSEGNIRTRTRTQTLTAHATHPVPVFNKDVTIAYGNDAAPNVSFTRGTGGVAKKYDKESKEFAKEIKKKTKMLDETAKKATKKGGTFTKIGDDEFESLFWALDRDDEKEFRMLFTPLARKAFVDLVTAKEGYGDDFVFNKIKGLNIVKPSHLKTNDLVPDPSSYFKNYDLEAMKKNFVNYNSEYFKKLFFGLAPLLAVPLYQQYKSQEYIYKDVYKMLAAPMQYEAIANNMNPALFKPQDATIDDMILKTKLISHNKGGDDVAVTGWSYRGEPRVDVVSMKGGDGYYHDVQVPWTEYIPTSRTVNMVVQPTKDMANHEFRNNKDLAALLAKYQINGSNSRFSRNLLSTVTNQPIDTTDFKGIKSK